MADSQDVAKLYKRKQIESATPMQLVLLLYDGALDFLNKAEQALGEEESHLRVEFHKHIVAVQNILTELTLALDMEKGGDIAQKLYQLYEYMSYRLVRVNINKDAEGIQEVRKLLKILQESWLHVAGEEAKQGKPLPSSDSPGLNIQG